MTDTTLDLIRRLPHLCHALEAALMVSGPELDSEYEHHLRALATDAYTQIAASINAANLGPADCTRAVVALEALRQVPAQRARVNAAGRVLMEIPRKGAGPLSERRAAELKANLDASAECISAEGAASRTLMELLTTLAA